MTGGQKRKPNKATRKPVRETGKPAPGKKTVATIYDVAAHAKVSKTTVSRVVNGEANVSPETLAQVQKAIKKLRYIPSKAARSLASRNEIRIGLLYNNPSVAYFSELLIGALEGSGRNGAQLVVDKCAPGDTGIARKTIRNLVKGGVNGMLLTAPLSSSAASIRELTKEGIAIAAVATGRFRSDVTCVGIDDYKAAYEMTAYLLSLGHRRIGFIVGHPGHTSSKQRHLGYLAAMKDHGKDGEPVTAQGFNSYRSGLDAGEKLLSEHPEVTAVFAGNDDMASAMLSIAHRKGLEVPRDISVVGFDDTIAASTWPPLTTVRQPIFDIAVKAIDVITRNFRVRSSGKAPQIENCLIDHVMVMRESTAAPSR